MKYFKLPDLGEGLPDAEILEWHIHEGDKIKTDQILVSVETAKAVIEVPSPCNGVVAHLFGQPGDTIHTGEPLVEFAGEEDQGTVVGTIATESQLSGEDHFIVGAAPSSREHRAISATPAVRALANRLGVDLTMVTPSQAQGHITVKDVEQAAQLLQSHGQATPLKGVRKQMCKAMSQSHAEVVPVTLCDDADISAWPDRSDITIRLIHAISQACKAVPIMNSWFDSHSLSLRQHEQIDIGIAVDTEQGLFVPVLRDVSNRDSSDLREGLNRLRNDVRDRTIPPSELQGATITLSNFGTLAGRYASPIVVPPQVTIIGAGVIRDEAKIIAEKVEARKILPLSLTFDHRVATGGEAARFLQAFIQDLEKEIIS